jgi:tetratricopeptide (TPR) repeat protein
MGDYQGAIDDFSQAIKINPEDFGYYRYRADIKEILKDYKGALDDYNKAIMIYPDSPFFYFRRATIKEALENYQGALNDCNLGITKAEEKGNCHETHNELLELRDFLMIMVS